MKRLAIILTLSALRAWGNACTSAANGNWNAAGSWANCGGGYPGDGDTVTITHNITVTANATVGNSPLDLIGTLPTLPVIDIQRTNGTTSNGQLTVSSGVTVRVKGSIKVTGNYSPQYGVTITFQPGSTFIFDNTANPTAVYRFFSQTVAAMNMLTAPGTSWNAGGYITMYGHDPGCSGCTGAILMSENPSYGTGVNPSFQHNWNYVKFWYFGSPTDSYRAVYFGCSNVYNSPPQQFYAINVEWHNTPGIDSSGGNGYPCPATDFKVQYMKVLDSTTASNKGWLYLQPYGTRNSGKGRVLQYVYLDRGIHSSNSEFRDFTSISYLVVDGQQTPFGITSNLSTSYLASVDHMLVRITANTGDSSFYGDSSYFLTVIDGGVGDVHTIMTQSFSDHSAHNWVIDHAIWQHGDASGSSDTDAYEQVAGTGITTSWNYMLMLPNAASPQYTSDTINVMGSTATIWSRYNHSVISFGKSYVGGGFLGSLYIGEQAGCGTGSAGAIGIKNSILWNPNSSAGESPVYGYVTANCPLNSLAANVFDPTQIHHNNVWNYGTNSTRWTSSVTACGGVNCTSYGTPYDAPMTGTVPGASDIYQAPKFLWQAQGITAPGPRDWAHIKHGADITTGESSTEAHFGTTFALFKNSDPGDTSTAAGMKVLIDEMFSWIYGEWAATNTALKGAADDAADIGAAPWVSACPTAYPAAVVPACNGLAQAISPADPGTLRYSANIN